jgi:hypothetical protein
MKFVTSYIDEPWHGRWVGLVRIETGFDGSS